MSTIKEIFIGIIAGLIIGLPQGMRDLPKMVSNDLPQDTILLITCLGGIGGLLLGMKFLSRGDPKEYSLIGYFSFLIGSLSIGIPTVIRHFNGNLMKDFTMPGLFFTSIGIAMILGGILSYALSKKT